MGVLWKLRGKYGDSITRFLSLVVSFGGFVEACGAEDVAGPGGVFEVSVADEFEHAPGRGSVLRWRKVAVGAKSPEMKAADFGRIPLK